jgi:hypothetical protein
MYHPVIMVVVLYRREYDSIALSRRLPIGLNKKNTTLLVFLDGIMEHIDSITQPVRLNH